MDASPASMPGGAFRTASASLNFNDGVNYVGPSFTSEASATSGPIDFGDGTRCIAGAVYRLPVVFGGPSGTPTYLVDLTSPPEASAQITAGSTWRFQCWYRDPLGAPGSSFNLSGVLVAFFCP